MYIRAYLCRFQRVNVTFVGSLDLIFKSQTFPFAGISAVAFTVQRSTLAAIYRRNLQDFPCPKHAHTVPGCESLFVTNDRRPSVVDYFYK